MTDPFNLQRFIARQEPIYQRVLSELKSGRKQSHWMWFIFPQIDGLGHSAIAREFAIKSIAEAEAYLYHPVLGNRLMECTGYVIAVQGRTVEKIFRYPDDLKFRSCMTLFATVDSKTDIFLNALNKYYQGKPDDQTLKLLTNL